MAGCPFPESVQLCDELEFKTNSPIRRRSTSSATDAANDYLPDCPQVQLNDSKIGDYLQKDLATDELDAFEPYLWLVAKQDGTHISPLTEQIVRGRSITITENPRLHLVWAYDRVFVKPLPTYLFSRAFWDYYLSSHSSPIARTQQQALQEAAKGLLRSYFYLIQHKSDFLIARDERVCLIPEGISYTEFVLFIRHFDVLDRYVSKRYSYGQLRLTRLNLWYKVSLRGFNYSKVEWQYGAYMARYYAPTLFVFAVFSLLLGAMQVIIAAYSVGSDNEMGSMVAYRQFAVFSLYFVAAVVTFFMALIVSLFFRELIFALKDLLRKSQGEEQGQG